MTKLCSCSNFKSVRTQQSQKNLIPTREILLSKEHMNARLEHSDYNHNCIHQSTNARDTEYLWDTSSFDKIVLSMLWQWNSLFYTHQCWLTYKNNSATLGHSFTYSCSLIQPKSVYYTVKMVQSLPHGGSKDFQAFGFAPVFVWLTVYPGCIRRAGYRITT